MNASTEAAALARPTIQMLPIGAIVGSNTHIQELRRSRFDPKLLKELAESIKTVGILQPIVTRTRHGVKTLHEIVAGERRWLAAKIAGLAEIPATVRDLSDEQVLEVQLIENLQREGLHELEEAEGYEELMKLKKISADAVADMVGRSRSYVFKRTKLLALCPEARKAFYAGALDASRALLIARIGHHDIQRQALKDITQDRYDGPMSYREALEHIQEEYMLRLKDAPFDINDAKLVPKAGSCQACPKRTGNQKELFADVKSADTCTDPKCFDDKRQAHYAGARVKLEAAGKKVVFGDAAKKIFPYWKNGSSSLADSHKLLSDSTYSGGNRPVKVGALLGDEYEPILVQHPTSGKIVEVATQQAIAKAANVPGKVRAAARAKPKGPKGPDVDDQLTARLAELIHKKAPKQFGRAWLLDLAKEMFEQLHFRDLDAVAAAWGWPKSAFSGNSYNSRLPAQALKLGERDLVLLMFHLSFAVGPYTRDRVLKLFDINEAKTRVIVIEERKAAQVAARLAAKSKAKPGKK